ncbi:fatty acid cis/trans isomerase [Glaciecola siphonariae]|uniref:Fatty acid cis/trans isomerase n=1 Tax=Glaciecola siphonariae TaxID=521012 RepID=A0ABV9LZI6_9ALTE
MKPFYLTLGICLIAACATLAASDLQDRFGAAQPQQRIVSDLPEDNIDYWQDVKPVVEQRCVVCHSCFDAPCQLKMTAVEGIDRGASKSKVYNAARINHAPLTRLFEDAQSTEKWREKAFFPVLNEHGSSVQANKDASLMYQLLSLKEKHPQPSTDILPDDFTLGYDRTEVCASPEQMHLYTQDNPLWGMPYALPGLASAEQTILKTWLEQGARYTARQSLPAPYLEKIKQWEAFLNGPARKQQLVNRYIYEHLFLANIYFSELEDDTQQPQYFRLVRSSSAPGQPVELIATRRPYDPPYGNKSSNERVYYRLVPYLETIVRKTHLPYALNQARKDRWNELFYQATYEVRYLPDYSEKVAANPFKAFEQLPLEARYKFMLDEAQFIIMNFIKGPVCRGQVAVNVIRDHFWVFFVNPDLPINQKLAQHVDIQADQLELPSAQEDIFMPLTNWMRYAEKAKLAAKEKQQFIVDNFVSKDQDGLKINEQIIWNGKPSKYNIQAENNQQTPFNNNAALTVFRHFDNASVHKGLLGQNPKTAWVIDYPLLERIYYLLVAGYDVYGNAGHQLLSRLYMDFLRMDGENLFLDFLPEDTRNTAINTWYQGDQKEVREYFADASYYAKVGTSIEYATADPKRELYAKLKAHLGPALTHRHDLRNIHNDKVAAALTRLQAFKGKGVQHLAELTMIEIQTGKDSYNYVSLIKNNAHKSVTSMFGEQLELLPTEHNVTVLSGLVGSYPNALMRVSVNDLDTFVTEVLAMKTSEDYTALMNKYGMRRTNPAFWEFSDRMHAFIENGVKVEAGYLDYNRLENR